MVSAAFFFFFFPLLFVLDVPHLTNEHRTQDHKTASLADEGNSAFASLAAHTTLNTYKPMEINIERSPQH